METQLPLRIILCAQESFATLLKQSLHAATSFNRIAVRCHLSALSRDQNAAFEANPKRFKNKSRYHLQYRIPYWINKPKFIAGDGGERGWGVTVTESLKHGVEVTYPRGQTPTGLCPSKELDHCSLNN
jgi:hypothetical protein